jgi:sec-independent protein translocase protein TatC
MAGRGDPAQGMSFLEHLDELRRRLAWSALGLLAGFAVCYPFSGRIFRYLASPIYRFLPPGETLAFTRLTEPFFIHLKVAALAGIFVASPFLALQVWLFVAPGLYRHEKRYVAAFVGPATACFVAGAAFAFKLLFPSVCRFFLSVGEGYRMVVTLDEYFSLLFWTVIGVALTFELPVAIGLLARLGVVSGSFLARNSHIAVVLCLVASAILTPTPDAMTMLIVAAPMVVLYFLSILVAKLLAPAAAPGPAPAPAAARTEAGGEGQAE